MIKFAMLSGPRSGTSLVTTTLNSHPDILCHGEIYHPNSWNHIRGTLDGVPDEEIQEMRKDTDGFLGRIFDQPDYKAAGFKVWQKQSPEAVEKILADTSIKKIIYERRNIFARNASARLAKVTGVYNIKLDPKRAADHIQEVRDTKIDFKRKWFLKYMATHQEQFQYYRDNVKGPVLDIAFDEVVSGGFGPILDFLEMEQKEMIPQRQKLHSSDIVSRFEPEYHDEIYAVLKEIGHPEWAHE